MPETSPFSFSLWPAVFRSFIMRFRQIRFQIVVWLFHNLDKHMKNRRLRTGAAAFSIVFFWFECRNRKSRPIWPILFRIGHTIHSCSLHSLQTASTPAMCSPQLWASTATSAPPSSLSSILSYFWVRSHHFCHCWRFRFFVIFCGLFFELLYIVFHTQVTFPCFFFPCRFARNIAWFWQHMGLWPSTRNPGAHKASASRPSVSWFILDFCTFSSSLSFISHLISFSHQFIHFLTPNPDQQRQFHGLFQCQRHL